MNDATNDIFRLNGATRRDRAVDRWLKRQPDELHFIANRWFMQMRACGDDVVELMHDGCPVACVEDAPFGYVNIFTAHVNVGFFNGAALDDPAGVLVGAGKRMRHVKLKPLVEPDVTALSALISAAYLDIKAQLRLHRPKR
jgi:hypothetical protein